MSSNARNLEKAEKYRAVNIAAAGIILRNPRKYAGLPVLWARLTLSPQSYSVKTPGSRYSILKTGGPHIPYHMPTGE